MTSTTYNQSNSNLLWIFFLLAAAIALFALKYSPHAVENHGNAAWDVRNCINKNGVLDVWKNPLTGRDAVICKIDNGKFGIQIRIGDKEVTSFIKDKMTKIDQVYQYLTNSGYEPIGD